MKKNEKKKPHIKIIEDGLWHFSYLGGVHQIIKKLEAFGCPEYNIKEIKDEKRINEMIYQGKSIFGYKNIEFEPLPIDETFPKYLRENISKFEHLIYPT